MEVLNDLLLAMPGKGKALLFAVSVAAFLQVCWTLA